jgi:predicted nucleotide-binding protein
MQVDRPALQPGVTLARARRAIAACLERGGRLLEQGAELSRQLSEPTDDPHAKAAQIIVSAERLPRWLEEKERWVRQTSEELGEVLLDTGPVRTFSATAELSKRVPQTISRRDDIRPQREAVRRGVEQLRSVERSLRSDRVMVIHGRNTQAVGAMFEYLSALDLNPITWNEAVAQTRLGTPHNLDAVRAAMESAQVIVALFTPDDLAYLRPELSDVVEEPAGQPRPNALLETGMALALMPRDTIIVHLGRIRPASDLEGLNHVSLPGQRENLAQRLEQRGCLVDMSSGKWRTAGDFEAALTPLTT